MRNLIIGSLLLATGILPGSAMDNDNPVKEKKHFFESMTINQLEYGWYHNKLPAELKNTPVIKKSVYTYLSTNPYCPKQLIVGAGHVEGFALAQFAPYPRLLSYTVDIIPSNKPDAILNVCNADHLSYFPTAAFSTIIIDFSPLLKNVGAYESTNIYEYYRILKPGGIMFVQAGTNSGWPEVDFLKRIVFDKNHPYIVSDDGRKGVIPFIKRNGDNLINSEKLITEFKEEALKKADVYFKKHGFSKVDLVDERIFKISRSNQPYLDKGSKLLINKSVQNNLPDALAAKNILDTPEKGKSFEDDRDFIELSSALLSFKGELQLDRKEPVSLKNRQISWVIYQSCLNLMDSSAFKLEYDRLMINTQEEIIDSLIEEVKNLESLLDEKYAKQKLMPDYFIEGNIYSKYPGLNRLLFCANTSAYSSYELERLSREKNNAEPQNQIIIKKEILAFEERIAHVRGKIKSSCEIITNSYNAACFPDFDCLAYLEVERLKITGQKLYNLLDIKIACAPKAAEISTKMIESLIEDMNRQINNNGMDTIIKIIQYNPPVKFTSKFSLTCLNVNQGD